MISATNLVVRRRFGEAARWSRSTRMATWCRPARAGPGTPTAPRSSTAGCTAAASRSRSPTSPPTPGRCWRSRRRGAPARRHGRAAPHLRRGGRRQDRPAACCCERASASPISRSAPASPTPSSPPTMAACISRCRSTAGRPTPRCPSPASTRWRPRPTSSPRSTPGARRWPSGVSAIPGIGSPQLTVGLIKGGINTNVVPDRVTFRLDRRMIPEERAGRGRGRAAGR